jgi:hypothetical protein
MKTFEEIKDEMRFVFGESEVPRVKFVDSVSELKVKLIAWTTPNPYKVLLEVASCTWGDYNNTNKWSRLSPEARFHIVKAVLDGRALPLAKEHLKFTFVISGVSRAAFDEIARARIGVAYGSKGWKDNSLRNIGFMIPSVLLSFPRFLSEFEDHVKSVSKLYMKMQRLGIPNWACRSIMPMYCLYRFIMSLDYLALQQFCANRMNFTEQEDVVAVAWCMREEVKKKFPLLAEYLRPAEDWSKKDLTDKVNGFAAELGVPNAPSGRWPVDMGEFRQKYDVLSDKPCTDVTVLEKYLGFHIPRPEEWIDYTWESLDEKDRRLFKAGGTVNGKSI